MLFFLTYSLSSLFISCLFDHSLSYVRAQRLLKCMIRLCSLFPSFCTLFGFAAPTRHVSYCIHPLVAAFCLPPFLGGAVALFVSLVWSTFWQGVSVSGSRLQSFSLPLRVYNSWIFRKVEIWGGWSVTAVILRGQICTAAFIVGEIWEEGGNNQFKMRNGNSWGLPNVPVPDTEKDGRLKLTDRRTFRWS